MNDELIETICRGICTVGAGIDSDSNGYGNIVKRQPTEPCEQICDYCRLSANHILMTIEEEGKWEITTKSKPS